MSDLKNKRVFVSGGAGVIGQELVKKLINAGATVLVGDLNVKPHDMPKNVIYRIGDLNWISQREINQFDPHYFFHLAATFERSEESYEHWEENFWHNIRLSNHLMTLIRNCKSIKKVINCSSYLIYDKSLYTSKNVPERPEKLSESNIINPRNLTGLAKLAHEIELSFLAKFKSDKFSSISARIFRGYGKNSRDIISRWIRDLLENKIIRIYNTESFFDYIYAEDTAEGLIRLALSKENGIINLGTDNSRRVNEVLSILKKYFPNMKTKIIKAEKIYERSQADMSLFEKKIGWKPKHSLENAIPKIIKYEKNKNTDGKMYSGNVLITSISKKIPLIQAVKKSLKKINPEIKVFGADIDKECLGKEFVDFFWKTKPLDEINEKIIVKFCKENHIKSIIPSRDGELNFFAKIKSSLNKAGIEIMVSNSKSIENCIDKFKFSSVRHKSSVKIIPSFLDPKIINENNLVVKERFGAGSKSIKINIRRNKAESYGQNLINPIYQPYIKGYEISIDAYVTKQGIVKGLITRKRDYIVNGESQITSTFYDKSMTKKLKTFVKSLNLYGHVVLQAIVDNKGTLHIIECNARFGGASTLALEVGLDSFYWNYLESYGEKLDHYHFNNQSKEANIRQIRFPMDIYK